MANDVSYFKVEGDDTQYAFDDADGAVSISALSSATPHVITSDVIPSTDDLDNYRTNGIWRTGSTLPANCPAGFTWSQLTVTVVGTTYRQELVSGASVAVRMGNSTSWYAWVLRPTRADIDITEITPFSSLSSGYTLQSGTVYKQGSHVFGDVVIACSALGTGQTGFGDLTYAPINAINTYCGLSTSEWAVHRIGYFYINGSGGVTVRDSTGGATFIKIHLDYVTS